MGLLQPLGQAGALHILAQAQVHDQQVRRPVLLEYPVGGRGAVGGQRLDAPDAKQRPHAVQDIRLVIDDVDALAAQRNLGGAVGRGLRR